MSQINTNLTIGSRGSKLALWQANWVKSKVISLFPNYNIKIEIIKTIGDKVLDTPLSQIGDKGLFTKEIEIALLEGKIDLAVHSLKDLPTELPNGLTLAAITKREDVRDALIARSEIKSFKELPHGALIGTSSLRRQIQIQNLRPDVKFIDLRGNIDTRLNKLKNGNYDAIILATAGLLRLGFEDQITEKLPIEMILPAVGQGALAIETRVTDIQTINLVQHLMDKETWQACTAERALLEKLGLGCQVPLGALATVKNNELLLKSVIANKTGSKLLYEEINGKADLAKQIGYKLADRFIARL